MQTTVHGIRRSIAVPLSPGGPLLEPYPEAQAILANMQSAIKAGTATAADAAQQLMALLQRQRDPSVMDSVMGRTRSTKPAPPGFGPTVNPIGPPGAGLQQQPYSALINGPVRPPPPGFGGPSLAPPPASTAGPAESAAANGLPPAGSLRPTALHQPMPPPGFANAAPSLSKPMGTTMPVTSQSSSQGYYSLWNGLPGFGLGGGLGGGGLGGGGLVSGGLTLGLGGGLWATQGQAPINGGGLGGGGYGAGPVPPPQENAQHSMSFSGGSPMATKAPPPGFGPAAHTGAGSSYQPFGNNTASASSRYNPLEYATGGVSGFGRT